MSDTFIHEMSDKGSKKCLKMKTGQRQKQRLVTPSKMIFWL
ncbi:hypothetical protein EC847_11742 [Scandinavium goeteborgense]|jgi:hypothetical protein|uniref:Uncharacterized protein n=1 Tax=Scandinavium goeteborgense TaxID=1851514 RepID=A0A4R6E1I0_SCAGO|nr:hypothetical protein EC847_11742 [Scandinavium goeteborgense]